MNNNWENKSEELCLAGRRAAFLSLGCKVNSYETQAMQELFEQAGAEIVEFQEKADIYVINTCTVTNIADRKSRQMLHRAKHLNPDAIVAAAGCYVQAAGEALLSDASVDLIIGNNQKKEIVSIVKNYLEDKAFQNSLADIGTEKEYEDLEIASVTEKVRAYIKIQDGCNQFCSYCIIPYARGRIRSRSEESVISEVERLAAAGYQEIVLTGIHLSSYGLDQGEERLLPLILRLCKIDGIKRIRLGSLEPRIITEEFVKTLAGEEKVCPHFHLSLQSGCDTVLKRMNRKYDTAQYLAGCELLRRHFEHPALTTDVIVGFPGETQEEFEATKEFLQKAAFSQMHIFKYSRRAGTAADRMPDQVPEPVKAVRSDELLALDERMRAAYQEYFTGKPQTLLIEESVEIDGARYAVGHNERYVKMAVKTDENLENQLVNVIVQKAKRKDMILCERKD
ncbi:MAG: tRNA (N(6)-L-threonylcarbamoyladenosine(37)-C(2))-methylthiotransferase MtaB [Lachnospiraceae bacterium]|nr:tRNA (N(6)-L-threonylcarbamoyladenosine(37)-C(2))-methylthiotransferase MtaB [Lachnospiraceae bacterium]